jgi:predicted SAM-dependent methyltransferase
MRVKKALISLLPYGIVADQNVRHVMSLMRFGLQNHKLIGRYLRTGHVQKLNIGCGSNIMAGWLNGDISPQNERVIYLNAKKRLPFGDRSFDHIYSEHLIEHLEYREGLYMLKECARILKPSGKIRISTPDLSFLISLFNKQRTVDEERYIKWAVDSFLPGLEDHSEVFVINNFFRNWGHKFIYDYKTLKDLLERAGFIDVIRCEPGYSEDGNFKNIELHGAQITDEWNRLESMVLEAGK